MEGGRRKKGESYGQATRLRLDISTPLRDEQLRLYLAARRKSLQQMGFQIIETIKKLLCVLRRKSVIPV